MCKNQAVQIHGRHGVDHRGGSPQPQNPVAGHAQHSAERRRLHPLQSHQAQRAALQTPRRLRQRAAPRGQVPHRHVPVRQPAQQHVSVLRVEESRGYPLGGAEKAVGMIGDRRVPQRAEPLEETPGRGNWRNWGNRRNRRSGVGDEEDGFGERGNPNGGNRVIRDRIIDETPRESEQFPRFGRVRLGVDVFVLGLTGTAGKTMKS